MTMYTYLYLENEIIDQKTDFYTFKNITLNCNEKKNKINPLCLKDKNLPLSEKLKTDIPKDIKDMDSLIHKFSKASNNAKLKIINKIMNEYDEEKSKDNNFKEIFIKSIEILKYITYIDCSRIISGNTNEKDKTINNEEYKECRRIKHNYMEEVINSISNPSNLHINANAPKQPQKILYLILFV